MRFEFDIAPVEQARPRATRMGKGIRLYDPKKVTVFKQQLGMLARRLSGVHRPTVKPDLDNYIKSTSDALNGIIWADDNLIISLEAKKFYAERPHLTVEIRRQTCSYMG
mgnify:CR=1 FL=1